MIFTIGIFQFHCKSEQKEVKLNKIKRNMYKSDSIFPHLQSITVFNDNLNFISNKVYLKDE